MNTRVRTQATKQGNGHKKKKSRYGLPIFFLLFSLSEHLPISVHPPAVCLCVCVCSVPRYESGSPNSSFDPAPSRIVAICHKAARNIEAREEPLLLTHCRRRPLLLLLLLHSSPSHSPPPPPHPSLPFLPTSTTSHPPQPHLPRFHYRCKRYPVLISGFLPFPTSSSLFTHPLSSS